MTRALCAGLTALLLAVAVIGGLITSTALTLVVIPVVYTLMDRFGTSGLVRWIGRRITGAPAAVTE